MKQSISTPRKFEPGPSRDSLATAAHSACRVEVVTEYETFLQLQTKWDRLAEDAGLSHPFLSHDWVRTWWECFGEGKELFLLLVMEKEKLMAIAPLMLSQEKMYGMRMRRLGFIYNPHTPRCDFLVARDSKQAYWAIWEYLRHNKNVWDVVDLCQMPAESRTLLEIQEYACADQFLTGIWQGEKSPYVPVEMWNVYLDGLNNKHRKKLRNGLKSINKLGQTELEVVSSGEKLEKALEDGFRIEAAAWKGHAGTAIANNPAVRLFYSRLAGRTAKRGWLRLHFLTVGRRRIAFEYSLCYKNKLFLLKPGYDPAYATYSPSRLLIALTLQNASEQGLTEFDMLGSDDGWKLKWTKELRPHSWLFVYPRNLRGVLLHAIKFRLTSKVRDILGRRPARSDPFGLE